MCHVSNRIGILNIWCVVGIVSLCCFVVMPSFSISYCSPVLGSAEHCHLQLIYIDRCVRLLLIVQIRVSCLRITVTVSPGVCGCYSLSRSESHASELPLQCCLAVCIAKKIVSTRNTAHNIKSCSRLVGSKTRSCCCRRSSTCMSLRFRDVGHPNS